MDKSGVVVQYLDQRLRTGVLVGVDVALEQLALLGIGLGCAGPVEPAAGATVTAAWRVRVAGHC